MHHAERLDEHERALRGGAAARTTVAQVVWRRRGWAFTSSASRWPRRSRTSSGWPRLAGPLSTTRRGGGRLRSLPQMDQASLQQLYELLRIESVSSDGTHPRELRAAADWIA